MDSPIILAGAAFAAGVVNSIAGGGSFLTFPALVVTGVPSIIANASSTVALFPASFASAFAYRRDFDEQTRTTFKPMLAVSLAGGAAGALLLLFTPQKLFDVVIPWLLVFSTLIFAFGPRLGPWLRQRLRVGKTTLYACQFLVAIYGGYFGGAVGIIQLAMYSLFGGGDMRSLNAQKTFMTGSMNAMAVICFIVAGKIWWPQTLLMLAAAMPGGYLGAYFARKVNTAYVRIIVVAICVVVTIYFFRRG